MAGKPAVLSIKIVSDAKDAQKSVDAVDRAFDGMESSAKSAARAMDQVDSASGGLRSKLDRAAEGSEVLADKSSKATGALGALSAGFELVGMEKYATGLQSASMATDFFSGVGDAASLMLETQAGAFVKSRAMALKDAAAKRVSAVATRAMAVAQRVLNVAMRANPIGLVITAVVALVAVIVIAYKRSETFRNIVQGAGRAIAAAFRAMGDVARRVWDAVVSGAQRVGSWLSRVKGWISDRLGGAFRAAKDAASNALSAMLAPIQWVIDKIQTLVGWIRNINWPSPPKWLSDLGGAVGGVFGSYNGAMTAGALLSTSTAGGVSASGMSLRAAHVTTAGGLGAQRPVEIHLHGIIDSDSAAREIERILGRRARRVVR